MTPSPPLYKAAATLGLFALLGLGGVALVHGLTEDRIAANRRAVLLRALERLVPPGGYDNDLLTDTVKANSRELGTERPVTAYRVRKVGEPVAAILSPVAPDGYSDAIELLVAVRADGRLIGVRVLSHRETPGLGDFIDLDKSDWILGFDGRSLGDPPENRWQVKRDGGDFDQFTGATITPRAVVGAVRRTLVFFRAHGEALLRAPAGTLIHE